jgi:hypothetical protein
MVYWYDVLIHTFKNPFVGAFAEAEGGHQVYYEEPDLSEGDEGDDEELEE